MKTEMGKTGKEENLARWKKLPTNVNPLSRMESIPYKARGSRYGACGVRIDGTPAFIDAVLGKLKDLLDGENHLTRLELARNPVMPVEIAGKVKVFSNAEVNAEVCYIRLHERGHEGKHASLVLNGERDAATEKAFGIKMNRKTS